APRAIGRCRHRREQLRPGLLAFQNGHSFAESWCSVWRRCIFSRRSGTQSSREAHRSAFLRREFPTAEFFLRPVGEKLLPPRRCIQRGLVTLGPRCDLTEACFQFALGPPTRPIMLSPGFASTGPSPRLKILAPASPFNVTAPSSQTSHAPSRIPTTGVSFSSRN